jgi:hypothetical protein
VLQKISAEPPSGVSLSHGHNGQDFKPAYRQTRGVTDMNFNLFSIIAASAISASVALPASASVEVNDKKAHATQTYTTKYLQQSANF